MRDSVKKALSVAGSGSLEYYLPAPLATEVIDYIRDINIMRRHLRTFNQTSRTYKRAKKNGALSAYHVTDGTTAPLSSFSTGQVEWIAKKLMAYTLVDEEAVEDSQPDVIQQVLNDFGDAVGEAEEYALLSGDPTHTATAPTPDAATTSNWFKFDPRLMFEGVFTVATSGDASTNVDASSAVIDLDMINKAIYNLGKYGRNRKALKGYLPSEQAAIIRSLDEFKSVSTSGQALASFITGLGSAGEADGLVAVIYGIPFYEAPLAPEGIISIMDTRLAEIGDRRMIKFKSDEIVESDQRKYVVSERISFNYHHRAALVAVKNLSTDVPDGTST